MPYQSCQCDGEVLGSPDCRNARLWLRTDNAKFYRCTRSGFVFQEASGIAPQAVSAGGIAYPKVGYEQSNLLNGLCNRIEESLTTANFGFNGRLLEVGCGAGFLLAELQRRHSGLSVFGIDPSSVNCDEARRYQGINVVCGTLDTWQPEVGFDAVLIQGNLMLHPNPARTIRQAAALLSPAGVLVADVKNPRSAPRIAARALAKMLGIRSLRYAKRSIAHAFHGMRYGLGKDWLRAACESAGLKIVRLRTNAPRLLLYENRNHFSRGLTGKVWHAMDWIDRIRGQRAWIEVTAIMPEKASTTGTKSSGA